MEVKKKKVEVIFIFSELNFDLDIITEEFVRRTLAEKNLSEAKDGPEVEIGDIIEFVEDVQVKGSDSSQ